VGIGEHPHFSPQPLVFVTDKFRLKGFVASVTLNCWETDNYICEITNLSKAAICESLTCGDGVTERKPPEIGELEMVLRWKIYMTAVM
jgi:hypothetical protein